VVVSCTVNNPIVPQTRTNHRRLPDKLLIGYATDCDDRTAKAVREGVNVVVWAFMDIRKNPDGTVVSESSLDFDCIRQMILNLDNEGYEDTVHLISFGGWNGPHLHPDLNADAWYKSWKDVVGDIFHGIDWDLEGHDDLNSPTNVFTLECLDKMGCISRLAKQDGYIIGMAPPQSYFDIQTPKFSRYINLTEPNRLWHNEFHYFGANVYAYLLAKYEDFIDFVSIQFYESYSRAAMSIHHSGMSPEAFLQSYVTELVMNGQSYFVNFEEDATLNFSGRKVSLPLSKLVFGFANGWAHGGEKAVFFDPKGIEIAYKNLVESEVAPRGFMFWVIGEEGTHGVFYARDLNKILKIRDKSQVDVKVDL
jgi:hypothetical protein